MFLPVSRSWEKELQLQRVRRWGGRRELGREKKAIKKRMGLVCKGRDAARGAGRSIYERRSFWMHLSNRLRQWGLGRSCIREIVCLDIME